MAKTPPPWTIYDDADPMRVGIKGFTRPIGAVHVATVIMPENAELIVKAVNNHEVMIALLVRWMNDEAPIDEQARVVEDTRALLASVGDVRND